MKIRYKLLRLILVLSCIVCQCVTPVTAKAQTSPKKLHIVFALDVSGSMNNKDKDKTALQVVKMLSDMCNGQESELGFVAYNDTIAYTYDMTPCNGTSIEELKRYVSSVKYNGETDIGLGLKRAVKMSSEHADENSESIVILLSDGKTDLTHSDTKRTMSDSKQDMEDALEAAKADNVTIYPIRLNNKFDTKVDYLSEVAKATNGISSVAFSPLELVDIVQSIVSKYQIPSLRSVATVSGNNDLQEVKVDFNTDYVEKTRIYILSAGKIGYVSVVGADADITYDKTNRYSIAEIGNKNQNGSVKLYFRGKKKSEISVYTQQFYSLKPMLDVQDKNTRNAEGTLLFQFHDTNTGMAADDEALYQNMQVECTLRSVTDGTEKGLSYQKTNKGIEVEHALEQIGSYQIELTYSGSYLSGTFVSDTFEVISKEPQLLNDINKTVCINKNEIVFDLQDVFSKVKSEITSYELKEESGTGAEACIDEKNRLICKLDSAGSKKIVIQAFDASMDIYQATIHVTTKTFWQTYQVIIVVCVLGALMLLALLSGLLTMKKTKKVRKKSSVPFAGSLIGYFMNLKSVNDLPALKWNLYEYQVSGITMSEMLKDLGIPDRFVGADKIWFYPKSDNSIELLHNLEGSIFIGTKMVSKDTPVTIYSGEKIFISFDESGIELELRYNA